MLVRHIEVSAESGPVTVTIGNVAVVIRRVGERLVTLAVDADRTVPIRFNPERKRTTLRD